MVVYNGVPYANFGPVVLRDWSPIFLEAGAGEPGWCTWPVVVLIDGRNEVLFDDEVDYFVCPD